MKTEDSGATRNAAAMSHVQLNENRSMANRVAAANPRETQASSCNAGFPSANLDHKGAPATLPDEKSSPPTTKHNAPAVRKKAAATTRNTAPEASNTAETYQGKRAKGSDEENEETAMAMPEIRNPDINPIRRGIEPSAAPSRPNVPVTKTPAESRTATASNMPSASTEE